MNGDMMPGARILDGQFSAGQQAVGCRRGNDAAAAFLYAFVEEAKASALVARLIAQCAVPSVTGAEAALADMLERRYRDLGVERVVMAAPRAGPQALAFIDRFQPMVAELA